MTSQAMTQSNKDTLNIVTSFSMPLKEKTIRNINKNKHNQYIIQNRNDISNFKVSVTQVKAEVKSENCKVNSIELRKSTQSGNLQNNIMNLMVEDTNQAQQKHNVKNNIQQNQMANPKFRQSNFSIDNQTAPQYLPEEFEETNNIPQSKIKIQLNPINPFNLPNNLQLPPLPASKSVNKISNVSVNPNMNQLKNSNISKTSNKQLKVSNAIDNNLKFVIPNSQINNTFGSMASFPQIGSTIPSFIQNDAQNQKMNKQQNVSQSMISNTDTYIGYNTLGSMMPSFLNEGCNTSRYATNPLEIRQSSYMGLKNPFQNRAK